MNQGHVLTSYFNSIFSLVCGCLLFLLGECFFMDHVELCSSKLAVDAALYYFDRRDLNLLLRMFSFGLCLY